jgi:hypothetical protein
MGGELVIWMPLWLAVLTLNSYGRCPAADMYSGITMTAIY